MEKNNMYLALDVKESKELRHRLSVLRSTINRLSTKFDKESEVVTLSYRACASYITDFSAFYCVSAELYHMFVNYQTQLTFKSLE